jgi:hypothetical protein
MNLKRLFFTLLLFGVAFGYGAFAAAPQGCPVTRASDRGFAPPSPYSAHLGSEEFFVGTPALWTVIYPNWHTHSGGKLPFFRQGYDAMKEKDPRLIVVARRLDEVGPLVWNGWASNASDSYGDFMTTGVDIPSSGCWEIVAHYVGSPLKIRTLSYVVWVEP